MEIHIAQADAPHIPKEILADLSAMSPRVFMQWNPRLYKANDLQGVHWEGRWEIWCELTDSQHPDAENIRQHTDRWNTDAQCWMRKLQVYQTEGGDFAPADRLLVIGLKMADTWGSRTFYEDNVEIPHELKEMEKDAQGQAAMSAGAAYYRSYDSPIVGAHRGNTHADWRWRDR